MSLRDTLLNGWRKPNALSVVLLPLSVLYRGLFGARRRLYDAGVLDSYRAPVPVIIVGNLTVGGTGKTPLVVHIVELLSKKGYKPGVISRGYGGAASSYPLLIDRATPVSQSGDEPALIVRRTGVRMAVGPNRKASIEALLAQHDVDVIISDDGLQHFALQRDLEICLLDDTSPLGNDWLLPAGPYREPKSRLQSIDFVVRHGGQGGNGQFAMHLQAADPVSLLDTDAGFPDGEEIIALAGIGNPQRFFNTCREKGYQFSPRSFADHHAFNKQDIDFGDISVLMTEKDAVKCAGFADKRHWYLPVDAQLSDGFDHALLQRLKKILSNMQAVDPAKDNNG